MPAVKKWGNSLAIRIPAILAQQLKLMENTPVACAVVEGSLVITPLAGRRSYSLEKLLDQVMADNIHGETEVGGAVGKERW
jgi:antitoxin MazE